MKWAQRTNLVFLTVCLEDCKDPEIKVEEEKLYFKGTGGTDNKEHEVTLEFFGSIDTEVRCSRTQTFHILFRDFSETFHRLFIDFSQTIQRLF